MPPKRRKSTRSSRGKAKTSKSKAAKASSTTTSRVSTGGRRCKSAYDYFRSEKRGDLLRQAGIADTGDNLVQATQLIAKAWAATSAAGKKPFEACAELDKLRKSIAELRRSSRGRRVAFSAASAADLVSQALGALGRVPAAPVSWAEAADGLIEALEVMDKGLKGPDRAEMAWKLKRDALSPASALGRHLDQELRNRLSALLQKWRTASTQSAASGSTEKKRKPAVPPKPVPRVAEPLNDEFRSKVVGLLMRSASKGAGKASFARCREVEQALFNLAGKDEKEYRARARSLVYNLGMPGNDLLTKVLDGTVPAADLVRLDVEKLAPTAVQEEKRELREKYFRQEVHLTAGPPKRRRDLIGLHSGRPSHAANLEAGDTQGQEPVEEPDAPAAPARRKSRRSLAVSQKSASDSESGSCSSSSDSEESEEEDQEEDAELLDLDLLFPPGQIVLPLEETAEDVALARVLQRDEEEQSSSSSSSSEDEAPNQPTGSSTSGDSSLHQLIEMGFSREQAAAAMKRAQGQIQDAIRILCEAL